MKIDAYPTRRAYRSATIFGAAIALSQLSGCNANPNPATLPPDGVVVTKSASGKIYLDECFTRAGDPNDIYTIQMNTIGGFYAGSSHFSIAPQLVRENGTGTAFGETTDIDPSVLVTELNDSELIPQTASYTNPNNQQHVTCQEKWPGDSSDVSNLIGKLVIYGRADNPVLAGPIEYDYLYGMDLPRYFAQNGS